VGAVVGGRGSVGAVVGGRGSVGAVVGGSIPKFFFKISLMSKSILPPYRTVGVAGADGASRCGYWGELPHPARSSNRGVAAVNVAGAAGASR
jgi:hypothetical protein